MTIIKSSMTLNNGVSIYEYGDPYFIAEFNSSHFGDLSNAKNMVDAAVAQSINCVKFQSWTTDTLYSQTYYDENPIAKRFVKKFSFSPDQLLEIARYCQDCGIHFASTPYSKSEVDWLLERCEVPFIKIASMEIDNLPFLKYIAGTGSAIILSTGMASADEIELAVKVIKDAGNKDLGVLHCVSLYPATPEAINLNNIGMLRQLCGDSVIGFSDHTLGLEVPLAAVALGVPIIEKHFTLNSARIGMDNQMATEPDEFGHLIASAKRVHASLGSHRRVLSPEECDQRAQMRRSIVAARTLIPGDKVTQDDIVFKRPGTGISISNIDRVLGATIKKRVDAQHIISHDDISYDD